MILCLNMIFKFIYLLHISNLCFAFLNYDPAVRESDIEGLVGKEVRLPCEVDKDNCGVFHNIKWYKGTERVFIFSESPDVKRPEGSLLQRGEFHYSEDNSEDWLEIKPLMVKDEGKYKCELTYLTVKESCSVVQFVNLKTLAQPNSFNMSFEDGSPIHNGTKIGPFLEGDDLFLQCQAGGAKPVPSVLWKSGSNKMQGRFHSKIDAEGLFIGTNSIQMTLGRQDLGKKLVCHVNNAAMPSPATLSIQLDVDVSPYEVEIKSHKDAFKEGDIVELLCIARGAKPPAMITWRNGSIPLFEARTNENIHEEDSEIAHPDGTFETRSLLRFQVSKFENEQEFSCEAMNSVLQRQRRSPMVDSVSLNVQFSPTVHVHPENLTLNESVDFILHCEYTANPIELTYAHWYLDGHQLDIEANPQKYRNGNIDNPSLFVLNSSADDMGEYTCRVGNVVGVSNVTNRAYVSVQYPPEVAVVIDPVGPVSEEARLNVTLSCEIIRSYPQALTKVRWFLEGYLMKELPECEDTNSTFANTSNLCDVSPYRLALENVFREFHGNYSCQGMNDAGWGTVSDPASLVVNYAPGNAILTYTPEIVIKGEQLNFTCDTDDVGRPVSETYIWTRNSHKFRNVTSKYWIIDSASLETEANFTCMPYNSEGNGSMASVTIDVLGKPTFIERLPTYHGALINAKEVSLTCRVECSPICEVTWLKDNIPLDNDTHYELRSVYQPSNPATGDLESLVSTLSWRMTMWPQRKLHRRIDNANYTCESSANRAGPGVRSLTTFRVEYPPEKVAISTRRIEVVEGNAPERISCHAPSYPKPNYYWLHKEETVGTGSVLDLSFEIKKAHSGEYTCVAENKHGSVTAKAFVDVLFKPECKINRHDSSSRDTSQILLICRAIANPENVSFRWRVANETLIDNVLSVELESRLYLEGSTASLGTYYCYVNNSVGESIPCEIDVTALIETLGDDNLLLYVFISIAIIIIIIAIIILLICCMRQRQRGKSGTDSTKNDNIPEQKNNSNPNENNPCIPDAENPKFYENLPFHGIQAPPDKNRRKYLCDPHDVRHNQPSMGQSSSSNSSTPSSQYQHPYNTSYSSTYNSDSPPSNFVQYPPSYPSQPPISSLYIPSSSMSQTTGNPPHFPSSVYGSNPGRSRPGYDPSTGAYSNSSYSNSGLPYNYKKNYPRDYNSLQNNGPIIGQEIDV